MKRAIRNGAGFTLLELLVSIAILTVVGGVALGLVAKATPLFNRQQGMTALNIGVRSAVAQIEQDVVNAGTGYYVGINFPDWPVGVTIGKAPSGTCYDSTTSSYGAACFDTLNVLTTDLSTPPGNLNANVLSNNTTVDVKTPATNDPSTGSPWTAANYAAKFLSADQILLLNSAGSQLTTFKLSANATVVTAGAPGVIRLTHTATNTDGTNGTMAQADAVPCTQTTAPANDYLAITMCKNTKIGASYVTNDWVLKLASVTYSVDSSTGSNPKLVRRVGSAGTLETVTDQIIGFKVGAGLWNNSNGCDNYLFDPANYPAPSDPCDTIPPTNKDPFNFTRVRSVRVSLIGRTTPSTDPTNSFRNTFDNGKYQIQAVSVVVNPRNLSMKDN